MKGTGLAKILAIASVILIIFFAAFVLFFEERNQPPAASLQSGTISPKGFGMAGDYGYATFSFNGTGSISLIALSEKPKKNLLILKQDYLNTERYSYFISAIRSLEGKGFTVTETTAISNPKNSIIIIPSGAMPSYILANMDNLTSSNEIIYIGKADLVYSGNLVRSTWLGNVSPQARAHLVVIEKTLEEFDSEKNFTVFSDIERNSWAERASGNFSYGGQGTRTVFIPLNNSGWLRMLPLSDSGQFVAQPALIYGNGDIFIWESAQLTMQLNYSNGTASYKVEKDGRVLNSGDLERVRREEAFFLPLRFNESGDYLVSISDYGGTIGAKRIHVKNLSVSLYRAYGNLYEFLFTIDGKPIDSGEAEAGLAHSNNTILGEIKKGIFTVHANLREGQNTFVLGAMGQKFEIPYNNSQEGIVQFYVKYLSAGLIIIVAFYVLMQVRKKPVYRIVVPELVSGSNPEVKISTTEALASFEEVESKFGWSKVPLYPREIELGLMKYTGGREINEGNIESVMRKLEGRGEVYSKLGVYGLSRWGNEKEGPLRRLVRDKLIENGIKFSESGPGFDCGNVKIVFAPSESGKSELAVFESRDEARGYLSNLDEKKRARAELRLKNGALRLVAIRDLDELL